MRYYLYIQSKLGLFVYSMVIYVLQRLAVVVEVLPYY